MPSQQQLKWSQLRVGLTVVFASVVLGVLIFLMSGTGGPFTKRMTLATHFQNTGGLRVGAPVTLQGVTIGNVKSIRVIPKRQPDPVEVMLRIDATFAEHIRKDSVAALSTAGVIGDLYVDIESKFAQGPPAEEGDSLKSEGATSMENVLKTGQGTLQNVDVLIQRLDRIVTTIEKGEGSVGKFIKDPQLFNRANDLIGQIQKLVEAVNRGEGTVGKLMKDEALYNRMTASVDKLNKIIDDLEQGKGSAGKFLKDEALYKNANDTLAKANRLMDDINAGKGTLGRLAKDEEFAKKMDGIVGNLEKLTTRMEKGEGSVGKLFNDPSLYNNADQMLVETRNLVKAIREEPKKYLTIRFRLF